MPGPGDCPTVNPYPDHKRLCPRPTHLADGGRAAWRTTAPLRDLAAFWHLETPSGRGLVAPSLVSKPPSNERRALSVDVWPAT